MSCFLGNSVSPFGIKTLIYLFFWDCKDEFQLFNKIVVSQINFRFLSEIELVKEKYVWRFMQS